MTITLPPELAREVEDLMAHGFGPLPEDVVRRGLIILRDLQTGIEQADRGELEPFDPIGTLAELRKQVQVGIDQMHEGKVSAIDPMALLDEVDREHASAAGSTERHVPRTGPLVESLCKRPQMYTYGGTFAEVTVYLLSFVDGVRAASAGTESAIDLSRFADWMRAHWSQGQYSWPQVLREHFPDDQAAIQKLADLYRRFRTEIDATPDAYRPAG